MGHRLATRSNEVRMKFFAVVPALLAAAAAEAQLNIAPQFLAQAGLYQGISGYAAPYAAGYAAKFAYGAPITALNSAIAHAPVQAAPVAYAAQVAAPVAYAAQAAPAITGAQSSQY